MHQDAHEFLNYLINAIAEILVGQKRELMDKLSEVHGGRKGKTSRQGKFIPSSQHPAQLLMSRRKSKAGSMTFLKAF